MINIVADKEIPYLDEFFSNEVVFKLKKLDWSKIHNEIIKDADVLISRSVTKINKELLENTNLKYVGSITSGHDHIDKDGLGLIEDTGKFTDFGFTNFRGQKKSILVETAHGANSKSVAEYTICALGLSAHEIKEILIIGQGYIGRRIKRILEFFDYQITTYDPYKNKEDKKYFNWRYAYEDKTKESKLQGPYNISVNVSYSKEGEYPSHEMINKESLIPSPTLLINTSRGEAIDYRNIPYGRFVNDVWNNEPSPSYKDFIVEQSYQIYSSPHIAGHTYEAKYKSLAVIFDGLKRHLKEEYPSLNEISPSPFSEKKEVDISDDLQELESSLQKKKIPFEFLKKFLDIKKINEDFIDTLINKELLRKFPKENYYKTYKRNNLIYESNKNEFNNPSLQFQEYRNQLLRKGFGEYELYADDMNSKLKEMLKVLGFKIREE